MQRGFGFGLDRWLFGCLGALALTLSGSSCAGGVGDRAEERADRAGSGSAASDASAAASDDFAAQAAAHAHGNRSHLPAPGTDAAPPDVLPGAPGGAYGFSHYVYADLDGKIVTTLVEGPRGHQVRCQSEDLPCSYQALKALYESEAEVPEALEMSRDELGVLVSQLDTLHETLARYESIDQACAEGYFAVSEQNPNMGIHMANGRYHEDGVFDPAKPEMLLFAKPGGEKLNKDELGQCRKGVWTGAKDFQVVGAAFMLPTEQFGDQHPEGFAGPLDNWHVHYQSCIGVNMDLILTQQQCEALGGHIVETAGWMIHAYAAPGFENRYGVFSMWNPTIPPVVDGKKLAAPRRTDAGAVAAGASRSAIRDFSFEAIEVEAGKPVVITNSDAVPHTVTAGLPMQPSGAFESGALMTGESFTRTFDQPGEYTFYCTYHPFMRGRIVVK